MISSMSLDNEDEPRRGASRANSVRFDESAIHGYNGQVNRSSSELPLRTGSGMSGHALTERSLSHRSEGRQSSSGHSHHSARTNSMGLDTGRLVGSSASPLNAIMPPPGLFLLGPVPCIIRCWLTTNFSNESLLYAAICSASYTSFVGHRLIEKLGFEEQIVVEGGVRCVKLPLYLPEASIHQTSSRAGSPTPQLPSVTVRFVVRNTDPDDKSIQIIVGSDVLRSHNADILFSQDRVIMVDDDRNRVAVPLVRPENNAVFKSLCTGPDGFYVDRSVVHSKNAPPEATNGRDIVGGIERSASPAPRETASTLSHQTAEGEPSMRDRQTPLPLEAEHGQAPAPGADDRKSSDEHERYNMSQAKTEGAGVWGTRRRDSKTDSHVIGMAKSTRGRAMKVLRPSKSSSRVPSLSSSIGTDTVSSPMTETHSAAQTPASGPEIIHPTPSRTASFKTGDGPWSATPKAANPVGGASAFGWLNSSQKSK
jgi:hypothetical protein